MQQPFVGKSDITGRPMAGWALVGPGGVEDDQLREWVDRAVKFMKSRPTK